ncbi:ribokinase [Youngiibacter fragilis]|uniref:Ribokinase n=1 Tax=Youngiibacter fragilis 232.1 TaxID=994573 RepID=V7I849_9CLOT|nr:ribokinase [Youngiibacter fragilis]ETA81424.1 ribokinase [Youngiibacter fragilis 232.1]
MKIVVVGSLNMDYILQVPHIPKEGETILSTETDTSLGGKGLNQAVAAARSGAEVAIIGAIGEDEDGKIMKELLVKEGIDHEGLDEQPGPSGKAYISIDAKGQNTIIVSPGANFRLTEGWVDEHRKVLEDAEYCIMQMEVQLPVIYSTLRLCREMGVKVIFNPAPVNAAFDRSYLGFVDYLVVNETELILLSGGEEDPEKAISKLLAEGVRNIIYTMGSDGSRFCSRELDIRIPVYKVKAVDTTAAGDTFIGAFASQFDGSNHTEAMTYASRAAALAVTREGAIGSIPRKEEVDRMA